MKQILNAVIFMSIASNSFAQVRYTLFLNITTHVHKPKMPKINPNYLSAEDWRSYANTPGHAK